MILTFSIGELFGLPAKPVKTSLPSPKDGEVWTGACSCGGEILYEAHHGTWVSVYRVWDGGSEFGNLSFVDCCQDCQEKQERDNELL